MNSIQVADQTFVAASPVAVGRAIANPGDWRRWWPELILQVVEDRGEKGLRWAVSGPVTGTMEVWLEPALDGVILHYFLHGEVSGTPATDSATVNLGRFIHARRVAGKKFAFDVKQVLEAGRPIGEPPIH